MTSKLSKCWGTSQNIQNNAKLQNWSNYNELHRFDVKTIKMLSYFAKHSKQRKTTKLIKLQWIASIWRQNDQNVELRCKTFKTNLNYKSDQNPMTCIDWMSKRSKQRYTTKVIKIQWLASIWRQNDQNVELRRKTFKTKLNYKSDQNPMSCIDLTSKRSKCWVTSQNIQKKAKLQKWSNYDKFASIWRQNYQNVEVLRKTFKTTQNYKTDQITMNCIDLTSKQSKILSYFAKHSKQRKTTKVIKL